MALIIIIRLEVILSVLRVYFICVATVSLIVVNFGRLRLQITINTDDQKYIGLQLKFISS